MAEDNEVLRQIWHANLPVCLKLADNEVATLQRPDPFYVRKKDSNSNSNSNLILISVADDGTSFIILSSSHG